MIQKIRGTQDFLDLKLFNFIIKKVSQLLTDAHFTQIATPILEPVALFKRSLGQETDVVSKEMFTIEKGKSSEEICLRPEATAPTVRAFLEHGIQQTPWKVFSHGPMFRYERPQKGRYRQFHQINIEMIGAQVLAYDAQLLALLDQLFANSFQLENYALIINYLGCQEDRTVFKKLLDTFLDKHLDKLCTTCKHRKETNILRIFDCKNEQCNALYRKQAPHLINHLCKECDSEWQTFQELLELLSVSYSVVPTLVRGLDYYNKTVFEFVSSALGAQSAFCSGGRYDGLVTQLGGKQAQPALGAAMGIERLLLLLENQQDKLQLPPEPRLHVILPLTEQQQPLALLIGQQLLHNGLCVETILEPASIKRMLSKANKLGARFTLIIGEDEQKNNSITIKDMLKGTEESVQQSKLTGYLKN